LDHRGLRSDIDRRPELYYGSVEFVATAEYCKEGKIPGPPAYIFVVDVGYNSVQSGLLSLWATSILSLLENLPKEKEQEKSSIRVGFITYGKAIQFFKLKGTQAQPQVMVLTDIEDVFMPLLDGFIVDLEEAKPVVESLLQQLPDMYNQSTGSDGILGPAIKAGTEALKAAGCPGKLFVLHSTFPSQEVPGKLQNREDRKLLMTDKEKTQFAHQTPYYRKLAEECVDAGVSVDLFLFVNQYIDVATVGTLTSTTGGKMYRYKSFRAAVDGDRFLQDLSKRLSSPVAFDAIMRVRCSPGIRAVDFYGNFFMNNTTDVQLACVDPETCVAVDIKHDDKLDEREGAYIQVALLYTSMSGQRRIRVHNLALQCSSQLSDLYRSVDIHSLMNFLAKKAIFLMLSMPYKTINERLTEQCAVMLGCYRKNCSTQSMAGQLILPECMKLLPLYANCILKNECLTGGGDMPVDDKSWLMQTVQGLDLLEMLVYFYPKLLPLHTLDPAESGIPDQIRCSYIFMQSDGVYLLENGMNLFIWVGEMVKHDWLQLVFGVSMFAQLDPEKIV
jgi:protein transport protein SEC24